MELDKLQQAKIDLDKRMREILWALYSTQNSIPFDAPKGVLDEDMAKLIRGKG